MTDPPSRDADSRAEWISETDIIRAAKLSMRSFARGADRAEMQFPPDRGRPE